ncbi:MAG: HAMP domain-containing histidine kinase [Sphingomonas sp.]|nr:HAMP domain-containing histidine kinase [Sphingomonas sp.]
MTAYEASSAPAASAQVAAEATAPAHAAPDGDPIDWTDVLAARAGPEIVLPQPTVEGAAPPRRRFRLRAVLDTEPDAPGHTAAVVEQPVEAAEAPAEEVDAAPPEVPAAAEQAVETTDISAGNPDAAPGETTPQPPAPAAPRHVTFVPVGTVARGIPVVAAALRQSANDDGEGSADALPQSETGPVSESASTLAVESQEAHQGGMSGEDLILADRDIAAADGGVYATESGATAGMPGPFEIADVVARIDAFYVRQQEREAQIAPVPTGDSFRFETDDKGVIRWIDGVSRAPLVGLALDLAATNGDSRVDGIAAGAFRQRSAFSDARLFVGGESDAAGDWRMSAIAVFDPASGRFSGYRGIARRPRVDEQPLPTRETRAADSLRQLMHELRTPTNAIAGFAEMIERQMLGEVTEPYRDRASAIREHARALLAAIDDLDIATRIEASALHLNPGEIAVRPLLARIADELGPLAATRGAWVALPVDDLGVRGDPRAVERLLSRTLATLVAAAGEGERVEVRLSAADDAVAIRFDRPRALAAYHGDALFGIDDEEEGAALLGTGFALRLIRNLARELSGALIIETEALTIRLPAAVTKSLEQLR